MNSIIERAGIFSSEDGFLPGATVIREPYRGVKFIDDHFEVADLVRFVLTGKHNEDGDVKVSVSLLADEVSDMNFDIEQMLIKRLRFQFAEAKYAIYNKKKGSAYNKKKGSAS